MKITKMTLNKAILEWESKIRKMGCIPATNWFCARVSRFWPLCLHCYTENGELYQHVVATNGKIIIDLAPYTDKLIYLRRY